MRFSCIKNDISMHENEGFVPGMIFCPQRYSWKIGMDTISYVEVFRIFLHGNYIFMLGNFIFMLGKFIFRYFVIHA